MNSLALPQVYKSSSVRPCGPWGPWAHGHSLGMGTYWGHGDPWGPWRPMGPMERTCVRTFVRLCGKRLFMEKPKRAEMVV